MNELRPASRYGDIRPNLIPKEAPRLVETTAAMIEHAHARVGQPVSDVRLELEA
jgi:hypothetical protein